MEVYNRSYFYWRFIPQGIHFYKTKCHFDVTHVCIQIHFIVTLFFKTQELWSFLQMCVCMSWKYQNTGNIFNLSWEVAWQQHWSLLYIAGHNICPWLDCYLSSLYLSNLSCQLSCDYWISVNYTFNAWLDWASKKKKKKKSYKFLRWV